MELEILDKRENPLFERMEVDFALSHPNQPTPKREAVRDMLSKELKVQKERVVVDHMESEFGRNNTVGYAKVYKKKEHAVQIERDYILKRNRLIEGAKEEKPKKEAPKEAPAKEEPTDEPAEEAPAEKKDEEPEAEPEPKSSDAPKEKDQKASEKKE